MREARGSAAVTAVSCAGGPTAIHSAAFGGPMLTSGVTLACWQVVMAAVGK
jgi:hypothetical protein